MTILYNKNILKERRKELRKNMTYEESIMWNILRSYFSHARFRRQYSLGPYIFDFYSVKYRVALEIDGAQHVENKEYDIERDNYALNHSIKTVRFWNKDIRTNLQAVVVKIKEVLES